MQRYRDKKIRVCVKDLIPLNCFVSRPDWSLCSNVGKEGHVTQWMGIPGVR